jgi:hypothetical protein
VNELDPFGFSIQERLDGNDLSVDKGVWSVHGAMVRELAYRAPLVAASGASRRNSVCRAGAQGRLVPQMKRSNTCGRARRARAPTPKRVTLIDLSRAPAYFGAEERLHHDRARRRCQGRGRL